MTKTAQRLCCRAGSFSAMKASMPGLASPIELSMPEGVSTRRGRAVALAALDGDRLRVEGADRVDLDELLVLRAVAEGARGEAYRVGELEAADPDA